MTELMQPDYMGQVLRGYQAGQGMQATKLAGQAYNARGADRQSALSQLAGVNPQAAMAMDSRFQAQDQAQQQQAQAQEVDHAKKINGAARYMLSAYQSGNPARVQGAYQAVRPYLAEITGKEPPPQWDDAMLPGLYQTLAATGGEPQQKPTILSNGAQMVDPSTGRVIADNPMDQQPTGELATLRAVQGDPALLHTYRQMHPRPASGGGNGRPNARFGWQYAADGSLEPVKGGPYDQSGESQGLSPDAIQNAAWSYIGNGKLPTIGRGKEGVAQRTAIMNAAAKIAKQAGISPAELQTVPGRNRALQSSLTSIQKRADAMSAAEEGFINNTKTALDISEGLDRFSSPVINRWYLGGKDALGDPKVHALDAAIRTMATDYARIMSGATGSGGTPISTTEDAIKLIRKDLSDKSLSAVVDVLNRDIEGQKRAVHDTRGNILGAMQQLHDSSAPASNPQGGGWAIEPVQ